MFSIFKKAAADTFTKLSGKTDLLEAGFAIAARAAAAQDGIQDDEIVAAITAAQSIDSLKGAFTEAQLEAAAVKQFNRAKTLMGRNQLKKEIEDIRSYSDEDKELAFLIGAEAANADGSIGPAERNSLLNDARILGLSNASSLMAA
jgi:tellurite resistance protein